jgi:hypothetical protein
MTKVLVLFIFLASSLWGANVAPTKLTNLNSSIKESSGLIEIDGILWTHNDSGGEPKLYAINPSDGSITRVVTIINATNRDWEDITYSKEYVYIGDFGNNNGNRKDLCIYRISRAALSSGASSVASEKINFYYDDQTDFPDKDFDCEAMAYAKGKLHLFSKNWNDKQTRHYILNAEIGDQVAHYQNTFNLNALVTGAAINEQSNILSLSAYGSSLEPSNWLFYGYTQSNFFNGEYVQLNWSNPSASQIEGISFDNLYSYKIGSEEYSRSFLGRLIVFPAALYRLDISQYVPTYDTVEGALEIEHGSGIVWDTIETTTQNMTADRYAGSCWGHEPLRNVWIKFQATSTTATLSIRRTEEASASGLSMALWQADTIGELGCSSYSLPEDDLYIHYDMLEEGKWYYVSIDSETAGRFTLYMDNHDIEQQSLHKHFNGAIRLNSSRGKFEYFNGSSWIDMHN